MLHMTYACTVRSSGLSPAWRLALTTRALGCSVSRKPGSFGSHASEGCLVLYARGGTGCVCGRGAQTGWSGQLQEGEGLGLGLGPGVGGQG